VNVRLDGREDDPVDSDGARYDDKGHHGEGDQDDFGLKIEPAQQVHVSLQSRESMTQFLRVTAGGLGVLCNVLSGDCLSG
jgi:hypothetical protein